MIDSRIWIGLAIVFIAAVSNVFAQQCDAEFPNRQGQFSVVWTGKDALVRARLAAVKESFGTTPNIALHITNRCLVTVPWNRILAAPGSSHRALCCGSPKPTFLPSFDIGDTERRIIPTQRDCPSMHNSTDGPAGDLTGGSEDHTRRRGLRPFAC